MATPQRTARNARVAGTARTTRVHRTEVSTDGEALLGYSEAIALVLAVAATLAAVWISGAPSEAADLTKPSTEPTRGAQMRAADDVTGATVLVRPTLVDGGGLTEGRAAVAG